MKNIWSAGFGLSKFKSAGFGYRKMHLGMQALALFFGSLQALDFKNQGKNVVCRLQHPPLVGPHVSTTKVTIIIIEDKPEWTCDYTRSLSSS